MTFKNPYCVIRKDIQDLKVPVYIGEELHCLSGSERGWRYRWLTETLFQIKYAKKWCTAYSIDFDFKNGRA